MSFFSIVTIEQTIAACNMTRQAGCYYIFYALLYTLSVTPEKKLVCNFNMQPMPLYHI